MILLHASASATFAHSPNPNTAITVHGSCGECCGKCSKQLAHAAVNTNTLLCVACKQRKLLTLTPHASASWLNISYDGSNHDGSNQPVFCHIPHDVSKTRISWLPCPLTYYCSQPYQTSATAQYTAHPTLHHHHHPLCNRQL